MESIELVELISQIDAATEQEQHDRALGLILKNFEELNDPALLRERVAQVLGETGREETAVEIYERVGNHYVNAGHPARVIAAIKHIEGLGADPEELVDRFTAIYNVRSPFLDRTRRHAGFGPPDGEVDATPDPEYEVDFDGDLTEAAAEAALEEGFFAQDPADDLPPLPVLSRLSSEGLSRVVRELEYERFDDLEPVREADAPGDLIWTISPDLTIGEKDPTYRLRPGTLLGLETYAGIDGDGGPKVFARSGSELLRLPGEKIPELSESIDGFRSTLEEAGRRAFLEALLEGHSLFEVIAKEDREELLGRFEGLEVESGTRLIRQNSDSPGLFVVLDGEVDLVREDEDWEITIQTLGPGEVFGEVGLVSDRPFEADVVMTEGGHVLLLAMDEFETAAKQHPELAKWTVQLARERLAELESTLSAQDLAEIPE